MSVCQKEHCERDYAALEAEVERLRADRDQACQLVARMHEAAVGEVRGPSVGVVEDVAALRAEVERLRKLHEALLNTLAPSKSAWIQHVVRNARAALRGGE